MAFSMFLTMSSLLHHSKCSHFGLWSSLLVAASEVRVQVYTTAVREYSLAEESALCRVVFIPLDSVMYVYSLMEHM